MPASGEQHRPSDATINPFEEQVPRISEFTAQEIATLQSRLDRQLGPEFISTRPGAGGGKVHYLAAEKVINLANEVFGFNGWSSAIQNIQVDFIDEIHGKVSLGLSVTCRVTLRDGTYHEDIGYGQIENCKSKAAAFEKAKKEAATDAMKRSLRNFGNVLGNCLYDKDYLSKISKIKVAPSKWNADNLHRHPDYAPIKAESLEDATAPDKPVRTTSVNSVVSAGAEYEDEFGGNLFDGVSFNGARHDEVVLDPSLTMEQPDDVPAPASADNVPQRGPPRPFPRVQSMPALRQTNGQHPVQQMPQQRPPLPHQQQQGPNMTPRPAPEALRQGMPPPQSNSYQQSRPQALQQPQPPQPIMPSNPQDPDNAPIQQGTSIPDQIAQPQQQPQRPAPNAQQKSTPPTDAPPLHEPPLGFVPSRSADLLRDRTPHDPPLAIPLPAFNPHADSPSIRRTTGINHHTSAPVSRQTHQTVAPPPPAAARANFANPQADPNRRIGMPGAGVPSPLTNRGAYRMPGPVKRPGEGGGGVAGVAGAGAARMPLADVSNVQFDGVGEGDAKRLKLEGK